MLECLRSCPRLVRLTFLFLFVLGASEAALATETDQFTTPSAPLADIGPALSRKIAEILESDRTHREPERVLSDWIGRNIMESRLVRWVNHARLAEDLILFRPHLSDSIYSRVFSPVPASFAFDAPTVHVHGFYFGTDKIDHFFQQGHDYFELVTRKQAEGADEDAAIALAVAHGARQEHTYYGTLVSGVYSNADLAANYAGMKFFLNLRQPVRIGDRMWPPRLESTPEGWRLRPDVDPDHLLQPFLSDHLDESMNPSRYRFSRERIRTLLRDRCDSWQRFYADRVERVAPSGQGFATTWFGEDYGHWLPPADEVSIATECTSVDRRPVAQ
jgi:hypothetical protein